MKYNLYYYLFYRLVRMNDVLFPDYAHRDNFPIIGGLSTLMTFNIFSSFILIESLCNHEFITRSLIISTGIIILIINYLLLQFRKKDKKICEYYRERETDEKRNIGIFFMWVYIVGTWGSFFYVANL